MPEVILKSPLQEKKMFFMCKYNKFKNRKVYTYSVIGSYLYLSKIYIKNRDDNIKEI